MPSMYEVNLVGKRQEILPQIFNIEAEQTPVLSMLATGKTPTQMLADWIAEVYPEVASTGVLDGTPATSPKRVDRYRLQGCAQHFRQEWGVTTLANVTESAGVKNEAAHQMAAAMLLLKRQMEQQFLSTSDCAAESGSTPWTTRGMGSWLSSDAQGNYPVDEHVRPSSNCIYDADTLANLSENDFRGLLEAASKARKGPVDLDGIVGVDLKAAMDDWTMIHPAAASSTQPRTVWQLRDPKTYQNMVDFLKFSAGSVRLQTSYFLFNNVATGAAGANSSNGGLFIDRKMWNLGYLQKPANTNLPPDGSGKKGFVDAIVLLRCLNPLGQIKVVPTA